MKGNQRQHKPERPAFDRDVMVPAGQSLLVGAGVTIGTVTAMIPVTVWRSWPWWAPPTTALAAGGVAFAISSVALVSDHRRLLWALHQVEDRLDVDLDRDGVVGPPEVDRRLIYVRDPARQRQREQAGDFRYWLRGAYNGRGVTKRAWLGEPLPSGRKVTQPLWEDYTDRLERAGLGRREYETAPLDLIGDYRDALDAFREIL